MKIKKSLFTIVIFVLLSILLNACTTVKPYQRGILSKQEMEFDSDANAKAAREHFLNSVEASTGGFGAGGGGCGCN